MTRTEARAWLKKQVAWAKDMKKDSQHAEYYDGMMVAYKQVAKKLEV